MFVIRVDRRSFKKENPKKQKCLNVIYFSGTNTSTHTHKLNRLSYHLSMLQATCPPLKPLAFCSLSFVSRKNSTRKWFVDEQIAGASPKEKSFSFFLVHQLQLISTWCCTFKSVTSEFVANPSDKWHYPEVFRVKMERSNWRCDLTNSQCVSVCLCVCVCVYKYGKKETSLSVSVNWKRSGRLLNGLLMANRSNWSSNDVNDKRLLCA